MTSFAPTIMAANLSTESKKNDIKVFVFLTTLSIGRCRHWCPEDTGPLQQGSRCPPDL